MAETFLSLGVEKLWDLLVRESERLQGVDEQFNGLKNDLNMLKSFLKDADAKKHTSEMVRNTVKEIKEIVLDTEDIVQTFLLKEELGKTSGIKGCVRRFSCVITERRGVALDMEAISQRISKVVEEMKIIGVQQSSNESYIKSIEERQRRMRQTFSSDNEDHDLVGLEEKVNQLVGYLMEEDSRSQVVSITGMGGIGKTTLARQVFNHKTVKSHFAGLAWVCVSQEFTREHVWRTILQKLMPESEVLKMMDEQVQEKLFQVLETQKALVVLDDIWREEDWDMIKPVFPPGKGWKILLTSRNEGVALRADPKCFTFKPDCLTDEESWTLFRRIAFPNTTENEVDEEMEELGKKMIEHCKGLPLAVKVLGGLLAAQHTLSEWKRVYENIKSHIVGGTFFNDRNIISVYHILYLSYEELPIYLKHCFLYFAHFPEDHRINVESLSYYWAGEGIQGPRYYDGASIRDVADGYIDELVKRNMVISERDGKTSKYETCQLHDMMREVCLLKAEEENFVQTVDASARQPQALTSSASSQLPRKSRRLAIQSRDDTLRLRIENPKLRSLLQVQSSTLMASDLCFRRLQLMRVLDLSWVQFEGGKLPSSIGKLIHLRYLSLKGASITQIPSSIQNLKQLIYLNLCGRLDLKVYFMSNFLKEMRELIYLCLPNSIHDKVKLELGNLVNLETLENFSTEHGNVSDLQGMTRLETLSMVIRSGCSVETLSSSLSELKRLENLTVVDKRDETRRGEFVLDCVHLRNLSLTVYMPRLPDEQHFPSRLTRLFLVKCGLEEDPMPILEKLHHLKEVELLWDSFCGRRMVCSTGGFPQLQKLELWGLKELEEWIVEEDSMPLLHTLDITHCDKLKEFPDGLQFITSLKDLSVGLRGEEWKNRLSEGFLLSRLTTLSLLECRLEEDPMPILEKLLHLKVVYFMFKAFRGRRMVCSRGGFPQLRKLEFQGLEELEEWIVEEGSMPLLHTLRIGYCEKLKELPDGLRFITSLKHLTVSKCGEDWKNRLSEGGEDYYKVQHIPSVTCDDIQLRNTR